MYIKILFSLFCAISFRTHSMAYDDPYDVLGLGSNPTSKEIEKRCRELRFRYHPDKGGTSEAFIEVNTLCSRAQEKFDQLNNESNQTTPKQAPQPPKPEPINRDGCVNVGDSCTCSNTGWSGNCVNDPIDPGLHCYCQPQKPPQPKATYDKKPKKKKREGGFKRPTSQQRAPKTPETPEWSMPEAPEWSIPEFNPPHEEKSKITLVSRSIDAPIYSIPLMRTLLPVYLNESIECNWTFGLAPYVQSPLSLFENSFHEREAGLLLASRFSKGRFWIDLASTLGVIKRTFHSETRNTATSFYETKFGAIDVLLTMGSGFGSESKHVTIRGLLGLSNPSHNNTFNGLNDILFLVPHLSIGAQADASWTFAETSKSEHRLAATLRELYFLPTHLMVQNISTSSSIGESRIAPGNFVDLLLGLDQRFGSDLNHRLEFGYDACFNTGQSITHESDDFSKHIDVRQAHRIPVCHKLYGLYNYEFCIKENPAAVGLGFSSNLVPTFSHEHKAQPSLFWMTFSFMY